MRFCAGRRCGWRPDTHVIPPFYERSWALLWFAKPSYFTNRYPKTNTKDGTILALKWHGVVSVFCVRCIGLCTAGYSSDAASSRALPKAFCSRMSWALAYPLRLAYLSFCSSGDCINSFFMTGTYLPASRPALPPS